VEADRNSIGLDILARLEGSRQASIVSALSEVAPDLAQLGRASTPARPS
jgi:hypothetical protein